MNYRLNMTVELDTDNIARAERWRDLIVAGIQDSGLTTDTLCDLVLADEFGEEVPADA